MSVPERIVVTASRDWTDHRPVYKLIQALPAGSEVIVGGARGGDRLAEAYARQRGLHVTVVRAGWDRYGRSAGHICNGWMLDRRPDRVVAFIRNNSPGASGCVKEAQRRGIPVEITRDDGPKIRPQDVLWIEDGDEEA